MCARLQTGPAPCEFAQHVVAAWFSQGPAERHVPCLADAGRRECKRRSGRSQVTPLEGAGGTTDSGPGAPGRARLPSTSQPAPTLPLPCVRPWLRESCQASHPSGAAAWRACWSLPCSVPSTGSRGQREACHQAFDAAQHERMQGTRWRRQASAAGATRAAVREGTVARWRWNTTRHHTVRHHALPAQPPFPNRISVR